MDFEVRHQFAVDPQVLWNTLFSPEYERAVAEHSGLPRQALSDESRDNRRFRRQRVESRQDLPGLVAKALGSTRLTYEMEEEYDLERLRMMWRVIPSVATDKVDAAGTYEILPAPGGCERLVKGRIKVAIPLVGGKIERAIGDELKASYEKNYAFVRTWLAERT